MALPASPYTSPSSVLLPLDGVGDDGPVGLNSKVYRMLRNRLRDGGRTSGTFAIPSELRRYWNFPHRDDDIAKPTEIRIDIAEPKTIEIRYGTLPTYEAAIKWCKLTRTGKRWKGKLPLGARGGMVPVRLDNAYFPLVAESVLLGVPGDGKITVVDTSRSAWSGPGQHMLRIERTGTPSAVRVTRSLDGATIYSIDKWIGTDATEYHTAYSTVSYVLADIDRERLVHKERALNEITHHNLTTYLRNQ